MVSRHGVIMIGIAFSCGLLFGLVVHLPTHVVAPNTRHVRDADVSNMHLNNINSANNEHLRTLPSHSFLEDGYETGTSNMHRAADSTQHKHLQRQLADDEKLSQHNGDSYAQEIELKSEHDTFKPKSFANDPHSRAESANAIDTQQSSGQEGDSDLHGQFEHLWETVDGVYWSPQLDRLTPAGFADPQAAQWRQKVDVGSITQLTEGCGRMQNRLVVFDDGSQMCARYRINNDQIQGEVYSYYLARVLGIQNVPPAILDRPDPATHRWQHVQREVDAAKWNSRKVLVLTPFVRDLRPAYIPKEFRSEERYLAPDTPTLVNKTVDELTELVQWSDLIILDYLTANVDRVVNNMFNLQWSAGMMSAPTHNLERAGEAGALIYMDNESGLLHSYRLLDKYSHYHDKLLRSLCIFRRSTVSAIKRLYKTGSIGHKIKEAFKEQDSLADKLSPLPSSNIQVLNQRLAAVYKQIVHCEHKYQNHIHR